MNHPKTIVLRRAAKKVALVSLIAASAIASFATLGDGNKKSGRSTASLLSAKSYRPGSFSLKSGYNYRGNQLLNTESGKHYINLNTTVTYQKGNTTFIVPLKKRVILSNIKIDIGNRQFQRN